MTGNPHSIVTVAGHIGSGKTEVCRKLSALTGWEIVSAGAILRAMAIQHGMTVLDFNEYAKSHPEVDHEIDAYIRDLSSRTDPLIVDSRLAWHFLPMSFKVFLIVEPSVGAARVFKATRPDESHESIATAANDNAGRQRLERQRFIQLYGLDCDYWRNYDLILDSTHITPEEGARIVLASLQAADDFGSKPDAWLSPKRLLPSENWREDRDVASIVDVAVYGGVCAIVKGHAQVSAAIRGGKPAIQCRIAAFEQESQPASVAAARTSEWEAAHGFQFAASPGA